MSKKKITAVIPIRKGSQRVKDKNLRRFANSTLLELKIDVLKASSIFDDIIVNTDSEEAIEIAISKGVSYHKREAYYASSECSGGEFFEHLAQVTDTDIFAYCPVTSPFITVTTIIKAVDAFFANTAHDTVATVSEVKEFLWQDNEPLNYSREKSPNSQDLPDIYALNFGITITDKQSLLANKNIIGADPKFIVTSDIESLDIDTPLDFYLAEKIYIKTVLKKLNLLDNEE